MIHRHGHNIIAVVPLAFQGLDFMLDGFELGLCCCDFCLFNRQTSTIHQSTQLPKLCLLFEISPTQQFDPVDVFKAKPWRPAFIIKIQAVGLGVVADSW
ncbi:hypothetical protein BEN30_12920 [Magnetovibrio blakemorei]|uniref:Uncharacterized protein n=1 Tax=Magnetovibrio blakemorei TaxID=28181 RepID=A0A1E5Q628_9PROT|nr:hypothetical protein BEN30_12920 [Magnetovibrio blakemorei]